MSRFIAAIDVGTTALKALLVDAHGTVSHPVTVELQTRHGPNGEVTQDPADWFDALCRAAGQWWAAGIRPASVAMIAPCGQMQDLVAVDRQGEPIGAAVLYADRCAEGEAVEINALLGADALHARLGNPLDAGSLPPKLMRWRRQDAAAYARTACLLLGAKDFLIARLTGACVVDPSTASTTGLYRLYEARWDAPLLAALRIDAALLPRLAPAGEVVGSVGPAAAARTGFAAGTPVICGLGDAVATGEGAALATPTGGDRYLYLGTSAWIAGAAPLASAATGVAGDGVIRLAGVAPGQGVVIAPVINGGSVLDWALGLLGHRPGQDRAPYFAQLEAELGAERQPAARRPLFLPFLNPERCPVQTRGAGGTFLHLGADTTRADMLHAVLDGTALALRWCAELLPPGPGADGAPLLPVVGGGTRLQPWLQAIADALGCGLQPQQDADGLAARGVARIAARTLGWAAPAAGDAGPAGRGPQATVLPSARGRERLAAAYPAFRRAADLLGRLQDDAA